MIGSLDYSSHDIRKHMGLCVRGLETASVIGSGIAGIYYCYSSTVMALTLVEGPQFR